MSTQERLSKSANVSGRLKRIDKKLVNSGGEDHVKGSGRSLERKNDKKAEDKKMSLSLKKPLRRKKEGSENKEDGSNEKEGETNTHTQSRNERITGRSVGKRRNFSVTDEIQPRTTIEHKSNNFNSERANTTSKYRLRSARRNSNPKGTTLNEFSLNNYKSEDSFASPQTYHIPTLIGKNKIASVHPNCPKYSFPTEKINNKVFISRKHNEHLVGEVSPGVGTYNPDKFSVIKKMPQFSLPKQTRFHPGESLSGFKVNLPASYLVLRSSKTRGGSLNKAYRFRSNISQKSPGPADYNTGTHNSMEQKLRHTMSSIPTTFGTTLQVFEHESKKLAKIGQIPGPADYLSPQTFLDSGKKITIPKSGRRLDAKQSTPGPNQYKVVRISSYKGHHSREYSFGKSKREFNLRKVSFLNSVFLRRLNKKH